MEYFEVKAKNGLKIREFPAGDGKILEAMPKGMRVRRLDDVLWNGDWYKIFAEFSDQYSVEGYSHRNYLAPIAGSVVHPPVEPPPIPSPPPAAKTIYQVIATSLRLREEPNTNSPIVANMIKDTVVTKIEDASELGWWKLSVKTGSVVEEGYSVAKYLAPLHPQPLEDSGPLNLDNITDAITRVQRFVGDFADALDEGLLSHLYAIVSQYGISENPRRFSHFMAQLAHESANFSTVEENLNYSATRLMQIFPRKFKNMQEAEQFARQPEKIANRVYANKIGNGKESSGDGYRYRGRGFIQLTGRANYRDIGNRINLDLENNPDQVATDPATALLVAADYWDSRNINPVADRDDVYEVTRLINGGQNGIRDRIQLLARAKSVWGN